MSNDNNILIEREESSYSNFNNQDQVENDIQIEIITSNEIDENLHFFNNNDLINSQENDSLNNKLGLINQDSNLKSVSQHTLDRKDDLQPEFNKKDTLEPLYIMNLELEGKSAELKIYENSEPNELAFDFCCFYKLDFTSMKYLKEEIEKLLEKYKTRYDDKLSPSKMSNFEIIYEEDKEENNIEKSSSAVNQLTNKEITQSLNTNSQKSNLLMKGPSKEVIHNNYEIQEDEGQEGEISNKDINSNLNDIINEEEHINENTEKQINTKSMRSGSINNTLHSISKQYLSHKNKKQTSSALFQYEIGNNYKIKNNKEKSKTKNKSEVKDAKDIFNYLYKDAKSHKLKQSIGENYKIQIINNNYNLNIQNFKQNFPIKKITQTSIKAGENLYTKGNDSKNKSLHKLHSIKCSLNDESQKNFSFSPKINTNNSIKSKNVQNINITEFNSNKKAKIEEIKRSYPQDEDFCTFTPITNKEKYINVQPLVYNTSQMYVKKISNEEIILKYKEKDAYFIPKVLQHNDKILKNSINFKGNEHQLKNSNVDDNMLINDSIAEENNKKIYISKAFTLRQEKYKEIHDNKLNSIIAKVESSHNKTCTYFPKTSEVTDEILCKSQRMNIEDPYIRNFQYSEIYRNNKQYKEEKQLTFKYNQSNQNKTLKNSEVLFNNKKEILFLKLFYCLDGDNDDQITRNNINLNKIPDKIKDLISPLTNELKEENETLSSEEFIHAMNYLLNSMEYYQRLVLLKELENLSKERVITNDDINYERMRLMRKEMQTNTNINTQQSKDINSNKKININIVNSSYNSSNFFAPSINKLLINSSNTNTNNKASNNFINHISIISSSSTKNRKQHENSNIFPFKPKINDNSRRIDSRRTYYNGFKTTLA